MPVLRSTTLIVAEPRTVAGLLRDVHVARAALERVGQQVDADVRLLSPGDEIRVTARLAPGVRRTVRLAVDTITAAGMTATQVAGPLRQNVTLTAAGAGTLVLDECVWKAPGLLGRAADVVVLRGLVTRLLAARSAVLVARAAALAASPVVVATALVRDGRLFVAQRTRPPSLAGRWELPGGRVEAGESEVDAIARECREELGATVRATGRLGTDLPLDDGVLRVHAAELVAGSAEPQALEHAALRWVGPDELAGVDWVDADRAVLADLRELLRPTA